jgi:hypothetical protein
MTFFNLCIHAVHTVHVARCPFDIALTDLRTKYHFSSLLYQQTGKKKENVIVQNENQTLFQ